MTDSEMETLRSDIRGLRAEIDMRFARIEAKLDEKPGAATVYQVAFGAPIALVGFTAAVLTMAKALGLV